MSSARDLAATVREALDNEHPWTCGCDRPGCDSTCILVGTYAAVAALKQQAEDAEASIEELRIALDGRSEPYQNVYNAACDRANEAEARAVRAEEALRLIDDRWKAGLDYEPLIARSAVAAAGADTPQPDDLTYEAWGIIANVSEGDWTKQPQEWQDAAVRWRDKWHATLGAAAGADTP